MKITRKKTTDLLYVPESNTVNTIGGGVEGFFFFFIAFLDTFCKIAILSDVQPDAYSVKTKRKCT